MTPNLARTMANGVVSADRGNGKRPQKRASKSSPVMQCWCNKMTKCHVHSSSPSMSFHKLIERPSYYDSFGLPVSKSWKVSVSVVHLHSLLLCICRFVSASARQHVVLVTKQQCSRRRHLGVINGTSHTVQRSTRLIDCINDDVRPRLSYWVTEWGEVLLTVRWIDRQDHTASDTTYMQSSFHWLPLPALINSTVLLARFLGEHLTK